VEISKVYLMLPVQDMARAVGFYRDTIGLAVEFESEFWTELRWRDTTIALHGGGAGDERESWLGFHVADLDAALVAVEAAGGRRGEGRVEGGARLVAVIDTEGNPITLGQGPG
jgi:predicted enzyme related to lactoylglutathione lyase